MEFSKNENFFLKILTNLYLFFDNSNCRPCIGKFKEYFYLSKSISNFIPQKNSKNY